MQILTNSFKKKKSLPPYWKKANLYISPLYFITGL